MDNNDHKELIEFLGSKFDSIDRRFEAIDNRFEAIDNRFEAIDKKFEEMGQRFDSLEGKIGILQTSVDGLAHRFDIFEKELIVNRHRLEKLEAWAKQVSEKLGIPLPSDL